MIATAAPLVIDIAPGAWDGPAWPGAPRRIPVTIDELADAVSERARLERRADHES